MKTCIEGDLKFDFTGGGKARKADDAGHGLSHCRWPSVDFVVETGERLYFVEVKDLQNPGRRTDTLDDYILKSPDEQVPEKIWKLIFKFRHTFLYEWASGEIDKPLYYIILIEHDRIDPALRSTLTDTLNRYLPVKGPSSGTWKRKLAEGCLVLNLKMWNEAFSQFPLARISAGLTH